MKHIYYLLITVLLLAPAQKQVSGQAFTVDTILYQGDVDYPINLVILGDGFLESEMQEFRDLAEDYTDLLFTVVPFIKFKSFFNAFSISTPSNEQGAATDPDQLIDNYFGSTFGFAGIDRLLVPTNNARVVSILADNLPEYDQVFMLVNSDTYGGSGGWVATASLHEDAPEIALHELGHSFADLADEYWAGDQYAHEAINMTQETNLDYLKWSNWYGDQGIGLFAHAESPSWYRPHQNCIMRYLGEPFCAVCREGIIESIYARSSPFKGFEPDISTFDLTTDSVLFKLELNHPEPTSLERLWYLNQAMIGTGVDSIAVPSGEFVNGNNQLFVTVTDTSSWIRPYEDESYHQLEVTWTVNVETTGTGQQIEILNRSAISIYPNPVHDQLYIRIMEHQAGAIYTELYDSQGKLVQKSEQLSSGLHILHMNALPSGFYMIRVSQNNKQLFSRIVIKQ
jgi:hypothetical protein